MSNQVRLQNLIGRTSLVNQVVKLAPNSTTAYVLADTPDPDAIGTVAESVPNRNWGLINLINSGTGVTDHGALTGLTDDDHTNYEPATTIRPASIINTATTPYSILTTDVEVYVDATSGSKIVTLPVATGSGRKLTIKKIAGGVGNTVTVTADTTGVADLIDGNPTVVLSTLYSSVTIRDALVNTWYII